MLIKKRPGYKTIVMRFLLFRVITRYSTYTMKMAMRIMGMKG